MMAAQKNKQHSEAMKNTITPMISKAGNEITVVGVDKSFDIACPCPYCGGKITASASAWEKDDAGRFVATDFDVSCATEPDIDEEKAWESWSIKHGGRDGTKAWHQLHCRIVEDMKTKVRFNRPGQ